MQRNLSIKIILISIACLLVGITIAYYNTASLGYDNANIFSLQNDGLRIFDITIKYSYFTNFIEFVKEIIPKHFITI